MQNNTITCISQTTAKMKLSDNELKFESDIRIAKTDIAFLIYLFIYLFIEYLYRPYIQYIH